MSDKPKSLGKTVLSWFIVQEDQAASGFASQEDSPPPPRPAAKKTEDAVVDDLIARYASGDAATARQPAKGQAPARPTPPPAQPAGRPTPPPAAGQTALPTDKTVVLPPGAAAGAMAQAQPAQQAPQATAQADAAVAPAQVDFAAVFKKRGLSTEEQGHVDRAMTLLANLPKDTPQEIKRQIVGASLLAFGVPVDKIIESAVLHQRALDLHAAEGQRETKSLTEEAERRLQELQVEMARVRKIVETQKTGQLALEAACNQHKGKVQEILDFFGAEAVERVTRSAPRLREG